MLKEKNYFDNKICISFSLPDFGNLYFHGLFSKKCTYLQTSDHHKELRATRHKESPIINFEIGGICDLFLDHLSTTCSG